jgi:acyl carrier protein
MEEIKQQILRTVKEICHPHVPEITDHDASMLEQGVDSLDFASILMALEEHYAVTIPEDEVREMASLNSVAASISKRL